jgi:hypothetical protein
MEVDREFLQKMVNMLDTLIAMTRDKMVWQNLAIPLLGDNWREKFEEARGNPRFLGEGEVQLADIRRIRDWAVRMLDQIQRGESVCLPTEQIN